LGFIGRFTLMLAREWRRNGCSLDVGDLNVAPKSSGGIADVVVASEFKRDLWGVL